MPRPVSVLKPILSISTLRMSDRYIDQYPSNLKRRGVKAAETDADFWKRLSLLEASRGQAMRERLVKDKWRYRDAINTLLKLAEEKGFGEEARGVLRSANK